MKLELRDIRKSFGEKEVLKGISISAESGSAVGLLGRNGAGKTTTIRILMGVFPSDSGEVLIDSKPVRYDKVGIGYLPEERGLYPKKTVIDQLTYLACLKGLKRRDASERVEKWLSRLGMSDCRDKRLDTLSKGNQQKIQLVTALVHDPDIVILDEPFSGLDPVNAMLLKDIVKEEISKGKIVLFSSHQMNYIEEFCDSIAILSEGHISLSGNLKEIKRKLGGNSLSVSSPESEKICADYAGSCKRGENETVIISYGSSDEKRKLMVELCERYDVSGVNMYEPSLADIFVEYAGKSGEAAE